jgi:hypothetical protein
VFSHQRPSCGVADRRHGRRQVGRR